MALTVNTNLSAMQAYLNLSKTSNDMSISMGKLSSGLRINTAADDAAGLSISEGLKSQVNGFNIAARNGQDGISLVQTADGALGEVHSVLQRMRDLAVQAGNDSNNAASRAAISSEATNLVSELGRISGATNFNGIKLLNGSATNLNFQIGSDGSANSQIGLNLANANVSSIASALGVGNTGATFALTDASAATVAGAQKFTVTDGTTTSAVTVTLGAAGTYKSASDVANALNADAGFAGKMVATVVRDSTGAATGLNIKAISGGKVDATVAPGTGFAAGAAGATGGLDFTSASGAQASISLIDTQIAYVSSARATLGAAQNRLTHAINIANISSQNLSAANSHITDTDMASEMVNYTKDSILSQAGTAMLAQANQSSQGILKLLG
ncbi:flagellin [Sinomonas sp. G460-2]|uniref:flagellin N-terminal helical domain-containing protein n=1 Tax=Sinomonas sp. G460-2 TaxID=3393464 RepID=UPI0039EE18D7